MHADIKLMRVTECMQIYKLVRIAKCMQTQAHVQYAISLQVSNGAALSNEHNLGEKNNCFCNTPEVRKRPDIQEASFSNSRIKRKPDYEGNRYKKGL